MLFVLLCVARPAAAKEGDQNPMVGNTLVCMCHFLNMGMFENVPISFFAASCPDKAVLIS